jgi:hypothetical protein
VVHALDDRQATNRQGREAFQGRTASAAFITVSTSEVTASRL